jgi:hypothetical protein
VAAPDSLKVFRVPGTLIVNPTNTTAPSYGGTVLGSIQRVHFDTGIRYARSYYDEIGRTGEIIAVQKDAMFEFTLRGYDDDALDKFFPSRSGDVISVGNGQGAMSASRAEKYLWAADRPTEHPSILLLNAIPLLPVNEQSLRFSILFELNFSVSLIALPASVGAPICAKIGLVASLGI